jgi:hypothetical protein
MDAAVWGFVGVVILDSQIVEMGVLSNAANDRLGVVLWTLL